MSNSLKQPHGNPSRGDCLLRLGLLILILGGFCRACVVRPSNDFPGNRFNHGTNAAWLGVNWVNEPPSEDAVQQLADNLAANQIKYGFFYVTYYKDDGDFNSTYDYAPQFVEAIKAAYSDLQVLAWVGIPLVHTDLSDSTVREQITNLGHELISMGFDGIHLNPEQTNNDNQDVLLLLEEVRPAIGDDAILSIATHRIFPLFPNLPWRQAGITQGLLDSIAYWQVDYYREVAERVDQIAVMTYDSGMPTGWSYRHWGRFQAINVSQALRHTDVEIFLGIPTYEGDTWLHRSGAENMENGLRGTITGLNDRATHPEIITGVAIYAYWETDTQEWGIYRELWLGKD